MMTMVAHQLEARLEEYGPALLGVAGAIVCIIWGCDAFAFMSAEGWKIDAIYTSVFSVATVITGFLLTFFMVFITTESGFIGRTRGTLPFKQTVRFALRSIALGAALTVFSIPMMVITPAPQALDITLALVTAWTGLAVWTLASFVRVGGIFVIFAREHL
jgi:hypothetical protein